MGLVENENVGPHSTGKYFPSFCSFSCPVMVFFLYYLMPCSLGHKDTSRLSADPHRYPGP